MAVTTVVALTAAILAARIAGLQESPQVGSFLLVFTALAAEALPFILIGAFVAAAIQVYVPDGAFERLGRLPLALQLPAAALTGFAFPVCECGSVPVARRLISRGMHPSAGLAFMLAAPVLNPVVLAATFIAYQGRGLGAQMVVGRAALGFVVAVAAGWTLAGQGVGRLLETPHYDAACSVDGAGSRWQRLLGHLQADFFFMAKFVVLGAAIAALIQTAVPRNLLGGLAGSVVVGSIALMVLAFALSLCSEADAFVAVSFVQFSLGAQLAFLAFGPILDAKLSLLYTAAFRRSFVPRLALVAAPLVLTGSLWFEVILL